MEEKEPHARVTLQMLYGKQLENERLLIELSAKLNYLDKLPERVSALEIYQAKSAWVEKIAWAALVGAVVGILNQLIGVLR
jgi:hypothetical protein